jgi:hypothetical protein
VLTCFLEQEGRIQWRDESHLRNYLSLRV